MHVYVIYYVCKIVSNLQIVMCIRHIGSKVEGILVSLFGCRVVSFLAEHVSQIAVC